MTERLAYQTPLDMSQWTPVDLSESEEESGIPDADTLRRWAEEEDRNPTPPSEDDELKEALRLQNFQDRFVVPDPSDPYTDDELWEQMPESIRRGQ